MLQNSEHGLHNISREIKKVWSFFGKYDGLYLNVLNHFFNIYFINNFNYLIQHKSERY